VLTGTYTIQQTDVDAGSFANTAGVTSHDIPMAIEDSETATVAQSSSLTIIKLAPTNADGDMSGDISLGDVLTYTITATNNGTMTQTNVVVEDMLLTPSAQSCASVAPMGTCVLSGTYVVDQDDVDNGSIFNMAGVTSDLITVPVTDEETAPIAQSSGLSLVKTALDTNYAAVGDILDYEYLVTNTGNVSITSSISVDDDKIQIPAIVDCPALPGGALAPGASLTCIASYVVNQADIDAGFVTNIASATDGTTSSAPDSVTVTATQTPGLTLVKTPVETGYDAVGDIVNYEYSVTNSGNVFIADLIVTDDLIPSVTCNVSTVGNGDLNLDPAETVICTGSYVITQADLDSGSVTNIATADGTPSGGVLTPPSTDATVNANQQPALALVKTAIEASFDAVDDVLNYEYRVENTGNVYIADIIVTDDKIAVVSCDIAAIGNNDNNLDPGEIVICTGEYRVTQGDLDAGSVTNNAEASGTPAGGALTRAMDDAVVNAVQNPSMTVDKTAVMVAFELPGDTVTYDYVVTNTGNITLTDPVIITDNRIAFVDCPAFPVGGLPPMAMLTCSADYFVTQADLDAGSVTNLASATSGPVQSPQTSETVPANQDPALSIIKTALFSDFTFAGEIVEYEFEISNDGNLTLTGGVNVVDDKIGTIMCATGNFIPGATARCQASYTITQGDIDAGFVTNQAYAVNGALVSAPVDVTVNAVQIPGLDFDKRAVTGTFNRAGDILNYEFDVTNSGNVTLSGILVQDDLIAPVSCPQTELAPTESMVCMASYMVSQSDIDTGSVLNNASVTATPPGGLPSVQIDDSVTVTTDAMASMTFAKRVLNSDFATPGDILNYEFDVTNTGQLTLDNIVISDDLVASVNCPLSALAPGQSMTCSANYVVNQADINQGSVTNNASIGADLPDNTPLSPLTDSVTIGGTQSPAMTIIKTALNAVYTSVGDIIDYEYVLTNSGNVEITSISVTDDLIPALNCPAASLSPGASLTCSASYTIAQADIDNGSVTNIATADGTPSGGILSPVTDSETVFADQAPSLRIDKTALMSSYDRAGDVIDYEYIVTNDGNVTITNPVNVSDDKIASISCPALPIGGLIPGQSLTCTASYVITQTDIDNGEVTNVASATDGLTSSPADSVTVTADQMPALTLVKTALTATFDAPGDLVDYVYEVINSGNVTITDPISVSDDKIASVICPALPAGGLLPGDSLTCIASYSVSQSDIDAGRVVNMASATDGTTVSPVTSEEVVATTRPSLSMVKTATSVNFTLPGDRVEYAYVVTNTGNVTVTDPISVSDNLIASVSCPALPLGGLAPSASLTCTADYIVSQDDLDIGVVINIATATDGTTVSPQTSESVPANAQPALTLRKSSNFSSYAVAGDVLNYTYEIENTGNATLTSGITIVDNLIGSFICFSGNFVPGQIERCTASYVVTQADIDAGEVTNDAYATNPRTSSLPDSVTITGTQSPALSLEKTALTASFGSVGDRLDYAYEVTNSGNVTVILPVDITDNRIADVDCPALPVRGLLPGASITCSGSDVATQADLDSGSITNTASASDGVITSPVVSETVTGDQMPGFTMDKIATSNDFAAVGDELNYDYIVRNTGNVSITETVTINDDRIGLITCPAVPASGLVPGATLSCTASDIITQADLDAGSVTNIAFAVIGTDQSAPDTETVTGTQTPVLGLDVSTPTTGFSLVGDIIEFDYVVTNTGNVTITDPISISDDTGVTVICPPLPAGGLLPGQSLNCTAEYPVTQMDIDAGSVTSTAIATDGTISSIDDGVSVAGTQAPALSIDKSALSAEFALPGDIISYEYIVTNTGNVSLTDPVEIADDKIASVDCPSLPAEGLLPAASLTCLADYMVTQADLDMGSVTNIATATSGATSSAPDMVTVVASTLPELSVRKSVAEPVQRFGPIFDVTYAIKLQNTGNVTLTNVQLQDDLQTALAPATLHTPPTATVTGLNGATINPDFDGVTVLDILAGNPVLPVGETATVMINLGVDISNGGPEETNTAFGSSTVLPAPVPSDDPTITPGNEKDLNPTPLTLIDTDNDGSPDNFESPDEDRDGDGVPDSEDYDPTGYFYCEENGRILTGGGISISGPNGSNSAIGTANDIVIVRDGSDGFYQFYVTAPGTYRMTPSYPASGVASTARPVQNVALDLTALLPSNPGILGSSEVGNTGILADFSAGANTPFYFDFDIEPGDPVILMNNIPLKHCGSSQLDLAKTVPSDPQVQDDGRQLVSYDFTVTNSGQKRADNLRLTDDLGEVFGDSNVELKRVELTAEPVNFAGSINSGYDGISDINLLSGSGMLEPGESLTLTLGVLVSPETANDYVNNAAVSAQDPLDGSDVTQTATASISLTPPPEVSALSVIKTAQPRTVQIGDPVLYTVTVTNTGPVTVTGMDIYDRLPQGFAYVPGTAQLSDASNSVSLEPNVTSPGVLSWPVDSTQATPLDTILPGETIAISLRLLAGPNVEFGAHENQAWVENSLTGERSQIATAVVDYIPEPTFDCTPVIGRVYDDVNQNGYPDDGEPGLPSVRLVTVNGDIITTDQFGRYHIPCAIIPHSERGSNFLLKADKRTLPLGYALTTENPRVVRATRGKFIKMNFGAAHRPTLRVDVFASDLDQGSARFTAQAALRIDKVIAGAKDTKRALIRYHAASDQSVDQAQSNLSMSLELVRKLSGDQFGDVALEAHWAEPRSREADERSGISRIIGQVLGSSNNLEDHDRITFRQDGNGSVKAVNDNVAAYLNSEGALRGSRGSKALMTDDRKDNSLLGRKDKRDAEDTTRPGRLLRWVGWGNSQAAYADSPEIETTVDALNVMKRLNAQANIVADEAGREIRTESYWNYGAFISRAELRFFENDSSVRGVPLFILETGLGQAKMELPDGTPENLQYLLRVYDADGNFDETAPKRLYVGDSEADLTESEWNAGASTAFGQNTLLKSNITIRGGTVRVYGRNLPGREAIISGQAVKIDESGRFVSELILPSGDQSVEIEIYADEDRFYRIVRHVDVKARDTFYVAQVETTVGQNIAGDADGNRGFEEGRLAFYIRSRLNDRWSVTATADTGEAGFDDLISGLDDKNVEQLLRRLDPDRYYPTYGDDSTIEQDAPTSGRIYARIERDDDYALWGNYQTNFNDTEYARVQRTLYGAKFHWDENGNLTAYGDDRTSLTGFIAEGGSRQGRDELRGTGGSVYYLRHGDIAIGSEILRIETRDSVSGLVLESRRLNYGNDYDMDFVQGRIILNRPLGSTSDDGRLFRDGAQSGNEELLVVNYEYTPVFGSGDDAAVYGIRGTRWFGDFIKIGATYNHDTDGGAESDLLEADLTLQFDAGTYIKGEIAKSDGQGVETFRSIDGGFTYNPLPRGGTVLKDHAMAYALEAALDFEDFKSLKVDGRSHAYWRRREAGFAGYAESTNQTIEQFGGGIEVKFNNKLSLNARGDISDDATIGSRSFAEATVKYAVNEKLSVTAGASFNDDARGNSGTSIGGRADYKIGEDSKLYAFGQAGIEGDNHRSTDRVGVGAEMRLNRHILTGGEVSTGEDGLGARASLRYQYEDGDEHYLAYDLPLQTQTAGAYGTLNLGTRRRFGDALSVYGEERFQFNETGLNGITHAYGVDYKPGKWNLGLSGELGRIDNLDREAVSLSAGFTDERFKAGITGEWRQDEDILTGDQRKTWLMRWSSRYDATEELRLLGKLNLARSDREDASGLLPQDFYLAEFTEASASMAYRPIWDDRVNMLGKLTWLEDLSPSTQRFNGQALNYRQRSVIASVDTSVDIDPRWTLGGKFGYRSGEVTSSRDSLDFTSSEASLGVLRLDYHATHKWDAVLEGRYLDIGNGAIIREGAMAGLYRHINDNAKIGAGVTWGGIDAEYLAAQDDSDVGWYLNVVGKF